MHDFAILFLCHQQCKTTERHLNQLRQFHDCPIVEVYGGSESVPGKFCLVDYDGVWTSATDKGKNLDVAWSSADLMLFQYHKNRTLDAKRWLSIEWDALVNINLREYWDSLWDSDLAGQVIREPGDGWCWFEAANVPQDLKSSLCGIQFPGCMLLSARYLAAATDFTYKRFVPGFSEMRLGTIARYLGFEPKTHYNPPGAVWDQPRVYNTNLPGVWHPVKGEI